MAGRGRGGGRGRGLDMTRPAWMNSNRNPAPSLPKAGSTDASNWRQATAPDGRRYWYNSATNETTWQDPTAKAAAGAASASALPPQWREQNAGGGRVYYYNVNTRETSWTRPVPAGAAPAASASAAPPNSGAQPPLPPGWAQNTAPDGRVYYYHASTRETRWSRPGVEAASADENKPPAVAAGQQPPLPSGWVEYKSKDGRPYYFHQPTQRTVWIRPTEGTDTQAAHASGAHPGIAGHPNGQGPPKRPRNATTDPLRTSNTAAHSYRRPRDEEGQPMGNRAAERWLLQRAEKKRAERLEKEAREGQGETKENGVKKEADAMEDGASGKELTAYDRKQQFMKMLDERGVDPKSTWFRAMCLCVEDERYLGVEAYGDRKTAFHSWVEKKKSGLAGMQIKEKLDAAEDFLEMLKQCLVKEPVYRRTIEDCRGDVVKRVRESKEYAAIKSEATRNNLTRTFFDLRKRQHEQHKAEERRRLLRLLRQKLDAMTDPALRPSARRAKDQPKEEDVLMGEAGASAGAGDADSGPPWFDDRTTLHEVERRLSSLPFYRDLDQRDVKHVFEDWIYDVDREVADRRHREKEARKEAQREKRAAFREGVLAMLVVGQLSFRAHWRDVAGQVERQPFAAPEDALGERPADLFKDAQEMFDERVQKHKDGFKEAVREAQLTIDDSTTLDACMAHASIAALLADVPRPIGEALLVDRQKKEQRRRTHARNDFDEMLRDLLRAGELQLDTAYDAAQAVVAGKKEAVDLLALTDGDTVRKAYDELMERRRLREARRSKRRSDDAPHAHASPDAKRSRVMRGVDESGWAVAVQGRPQSAEEKAAALEKKKRDLLASLKAGKAARSNGNGAAAVKREVKREQL